MEEDIKILELVLKYYDKDTAYGNKLLKREKVALENVINRVKEDKAVIERMAEFMNKRSWKEHQLKDETCHCCRIEYGSDECASCIEGYFRKKIKNEEEI